MEGNQEVSLGRRGYWFVLPRREEKWARSNKKGQEGEQGVWRSRQLHFSGATGEKGPSGNSQVSVGTRRQREFSEKNGEGSRRFTGGKSGRLSQVRDSQGCLDMRVWMSINHLEALLK